MHSLPLFVRLTGRPVILLGEGVSADAKRRLLNRAGAIIVGEQDEAALAIVAIDDEDDACAAVARLKARNILINAVDRPSLCDFTLPAIVDRDPVLIAIGTGGASAGLAKELRQRLEALLPASLGRLGNGLLQSRAAIRTRWPDPADRRRALDKAVKPGAVLDPMATGAADAIEQWISADADHATPSASVILLRSDDPDDLSLREARLFASADLVIHDETVAAAILDRARADAERRAGHSLPDPLPPGLTLLVARG